jgi:hypothetical protein
MCSKISSKFEYRPTNPAGYFPSFFFEIVVKAVGGGFKGLAAGPLPVPSVSWQDAQYFTKVSFPEAISGRFSQGFCHGV